MEDTLTTQVLMSSRERKRIRPRRERERIRPRVQKSHPCTIISSLALDHTIGRAEGDRGVADFDQEDDEDGKEKGDDMVDDWCNEALQDGSYDV